MSGSHHVGNIGKRLITGGRLAYPIPISFYMRGGRDQELYLEGLHLTTHLEHPPLVIRTIIVVPSVSSEVKKS